MTFNNAAAMIKKRIKSSLAGNDSSIDEANDSVIELVSSSAREEVKSSDKNTK